MTTHPQRFGGRENVGFSWRCWLCLSTNKTLVSSFSHDHIPLLINEQQPLWDSVCQSILD